MLARLLDTLRSKRVARDAFGRPVRADEAAAGDAFEHAPDLGPDDVPPGERIGFDGKPMRRDRPNNGQFPTGGASGGF